MKIKLDGSWCANVKLNVLVQ